MHVSWCLLRNLIGLLSDCVRGKMDLLRLARNIVLNLRFPVARSATRAISLFLRLGNLLVLVISVICLRKLVRALLVPLPTNLLVIEVSRVRPLNCDLLRGLPEVRNLLIRLDRLSIVLITLLGLVLELSSTCSLLSKVRNVLTWALVWGLTLALDVWCKVVLKATRL